MYGTFQNIKAIKSQDEFRDKTNPGVIMISVSRAVEQSQGMLAKFKNYAPGFKGPITPEESIKAVQSVVNALASRTETGAFLSPPG